MDSGAASPPPFTPPPPPTTQRLVSQPHATERQKVTAGNNTTRRLLKDTYDQARALQCFTSKRTSSVPLPIIDFAGTEEAAQPAAITARLQAFLLHRVGDRVIAHVSSYDDVAKKCAEVERACEELAYTYGNLLVYLQSLVRELQGLEARELSTREPELADSTTPVAQWRVSSHSATVAHADSDVLLGVRGSIYSGLARVHSLLSLLKETFSFVFSTRFTAEALTSLRGNQGTRSAWAGQGGPVISIKRESFGRRGVAARAAEAAAARAAAAAGAAPAPLPPRAPRAPRAAAARAVAHGGVAAAADDEPVVADDDAYAPSDSAAASAASSAGAMARPRGKKLPRWR